MTFPKVELSPSATLIRLFMLLLLLVALIWLARSVLPVISVFAVGGIGAYLLGPIVRFLRAKTNMPKGLAIAIVVVSLLGLAVLVVRLVIPPVYNQTLSLVANLPAYRRAALALLEKWTLQSAKGSVAEMFFSWINDGLLESPIDFSTVLTDIGGAIISFPSKLFQIFMMLLTLVYFLICGEDLYRIFVHLFPVKTRFVVRRILSKCDKVAWRYLKARVMVSSIMATATFIGFTIFKLDYALLLALLAFVLDFIPYFGSITGGVVACAVMLFTQGFLPAIYLALFILCVQQIECNILSPRIEGGSMGISPIIILFAIFCCNEIFGFMGMLLATPLTSIARILFEEFQAYYISLEDPPEEAPGA